MKVDRQELIDALTRVQPGLASQESIEQSASFVFTAGRVYTYNDEVAVSGPSPLELDGAVPGETLFRLLSKSKDEALNFEATDEGLAISGRRKKAVIRLEAEIRLPLSELGEPEKWHKLPADFNEVVRFCQFSAARAGSSPGLTCVHVSGEYAESCDNYRMTRRYFDKPGTRRFKHALLIPAANIPALTGHVPHEYARTEGWLHFRNGAGVVFSLRSFAAKFPDLSAFLAGASKGEAVDVPPEIVGALERADVFNDRRPGIVTKVEITMGGGRLTVRGRGEAGHFEEHVLVKYRGAPVEFAVNPDFLAEALGLFQQIVVGEHLELVGGGFNHVVCITKVKDEEPEDEEEE